MTMDYPQMYEALLMKKSTINKLKNLVNYRLVLLKMKKDIDKFCNNDSCEAIVDR